MSALNSSKPISGTNTVRGMLYISVTALAGSIMAAMTKYLTLTMHPFNITFYRVLFSFLSFTPLLFRHGFKPLKSDRKRLHALRGAIQVVQLCMGITGLKYVTIAKFTALRFTGPMFATILTILFLGERFHMRRAAALTIGFIGAMVILRPGIIPIEFTTLLPLGSAAAWAFISIIIKRLTQTDSSVTITFYSTIFMLPLAIAVSLPVFVLPNWQELALLMAVGLLNSIGHVCRAQAFKEADLSAVVPVEFTRLIWVSIFGFVLFNEVPEIWVWIGGIMIFSSNTYIAIRERNFSKPNKTASPPSND
ncbi:MAG: DMT family transporter [Rhodospirillaceae bacterium]|jgi:drug/metabolite transporter (DMT)-like permease